MGQETVETITRTWMERVCNQLDTTAIDELISDDHVSYGAGDPIEGKAGCTGSMLRLRRPLVIFE